MLFRRLPIVLVFFIFLVSLVSCATVEKPTAQSEFDVGLSLFNRGRFEEAIPRFERSTELDPNFGKAYLYLGRSYLSLGRWQEAVPPIRTAFRLSPEESRMEISEIIVDVMLRNAFRIDPETQSQFREIFREK